MLDLNLSSNYAPRDDDLNRFSLHSKYKPYRTQMHPMSQIFQFYAPNQHLPVLHHIYHLENQIQYILHHYF